MYCGWWGTKTKEATGLKEGGEREVLRAHGSGRGSKDSYKTDSAKKKGKGASSRKSKVAQCITKYSMQISDGNLCNCRLQCSDQLVVIMTGIWSLPSSLGFQLVGLF